MLRRPEIAAAEFAKTVEVKPVAVIPHEAKLFGAAANNGQMIAEIDPKGKIAQTFDELAKTVAGWTAQPKSKKGLVDLVKAALAWVRE